MADLKVFLETHIESARALWNQTEWASVSQSDEPDALRAFLHRNPGRSWVAESDAGLIGTVLAGHDGRRGYIYHLVVDEARRGEGIGRALLNKALASLRRAGVLKCHAIVLNGNPAVDSFWLRDGWLPKDTTQFSKFLT